MAQVAVESGCYKVPWPKWTVRGSTDLAADALVAQSTELEHV